MINIAPFGGCGLHNPISGLRRLNMAESVFGRPMGFQNSPFSLSANANLQLLDFVTGKLEIPGWIRRLTYADASHQPTPEQGKAVDNADIVIVEMSTPIEYIFEGHLLNINLFEEVMVQELAALEGHKKLITKWRSSLLKGKEDVRTETSEELYKLVPREGEHQENLAKFIRDTRSRILGPDEMTKAIAELRERMGKPLGLILHNFQFMPDGRSVSWPAEFKNDSAEVAKRLELPTLDFAEFVERNGVGRVMAADRRHWEPRFYPRIAEHIFDFAANVLGHRPMREQIAAIRTAEREAAMDYLETDTEMAKPDGISHSPRLARYTFDFESGGYLPDVANTVHVVVVIGNGWATGATADEMDLVPATIGCEHEGHAFMFDEGIRPNGKPVKAFVPLRETVIGTSKETPCSGIADQIIRNCDDRFAEKPTLLFVVVADPGGTVSGMGMAPESGLMRGSRQHAQVLQYVKRASQIAAEGNKRIEVLAVCLLAGERETQLKQFNASEFERQLSVLQSQYDSDLRRVTGQADAVRMLVTQANRAPKEAFKVAPTAAAQLRVQDRNPNVRCVGPTYGVPTEVRASGHPLYPNPLGYRRLGQQIGKFIIEDIWGPGRTALYATEHYWLGPKTLRVRFSHPIVIETEDTQVRVSDLGPGAGLVFDDGTPWTPSIESVSTMRHIEDELEIELTSPSIGPRKRLLIAAVPSVKGSTGNLTGARSAIRSRRPFDQDPLDGVDLYDWACTQELAVP